MRPIGLELALRRDGELLVSDLIPQLGKDARRADGARVPRMRGFAARSLAEPRRRLAQPLSARFERAIHFAAYRVDKIGQSCLRFGGNVDVGASISLMSAVIRFLRESRRSDSNNHRIGLNARRYGAYRQILQTVEHAKQIARLERENDVRIANRWSGDQCMIERMLGWKIHPPARIDYRGLKGFGQLH